MPRLCAAALVLGLGASVDAGQPPAPPSPIFHFATDEFWLNLHHFLYVLGRSEAKMSNVARDAVKGAPADAEQGLAGLTDDERKRWRDAVTFYATGPSRKDAVFDQPLPSITRVLADAGDRPQLEGVAIDAPLRSTLERAAPIYRKAWWPAQHASNIGWRDEIQALVDRHGAAVLAFITHAYGLEWPAGGYAVHLSGYSNWAGAYSTIGNLLVVSSFARDLRGLDGLETVFHEGMHQWDKAINDLIFAEAQRTNKRLPPGVSHALIFFTAGYAVRRIAPDHVPYADANGVWQRGMQSLRAAAEEAWQPYLDGHGTRDEALAALVAKAGIAR
jgi:hypothetical protein